MYINLFILILVIWLVWGIVEALIRRVHAGNVLLNFVLNREKAIAYANSLAAPPRTSSTNAVYALQAARDKVDPVEIGTIVALTDAIDGLRFTANHTLFDIK